MNLLPFDLINSLGIGAKQAIEAVEQLALALKELEGNDQITEKTLDSIIPLPTNSNKSSHAEGPLSLATGEPAIVKNITNRIIPIEEDDIL